MKLNQLFIDQDQQAVIKVLSHPLKIEREIAGAKIFSHYCQVPLISRLDSRTLKFSLMSGTRADQVSDYILTPAVVRLLSFVRVNPPDVYLPQASIFCQTEFLAELPADRPQIAKFLLSLSKSLDGAKLYPVHGDLQKQNIFIPDSGQLALIDFEYFTFAPQELELANSLFFSDANCLDVASVFSALNLCPYLLAQMLIFYSIRQLAQGYPVRFVQSHLNQGLVKIFHFTNLHPSVISTPNFSQVIPARKSSSCFLVN